MGQRFLFLPLSGLGPPNPTQLIGMGRVSLGQPNPTDSLSLSKAIVDFVKIHRFLTNLNRRKSTYFHSESTFIESIENFDFVDSFFISEYASESSINHFLENSYVEQKALSKFSSHVSSQKFNMQDSSVLESFRENSN